MPRSIQFILMLLGVRERAAVSDKRIVRNRPVIWIDRRTTDDILLQGKMPRWKPVNVVSSLSMSTPTWSWLRLQSQSDVLVCGNMSLNKPRSSTPLPQFTPWQGTQQPSHRHHLCHSTSRAHDKASTRRILSLSAVSHFDQVTSQFQ